MRRTVYIIALIASFAALTLPQLGCAGGGPSTSGTSFTVYTYTGSGTWPNASVTGSAGPGTYSCNPNTDTNCVTSFPASSTGTKGKFTFPTDALPAQWEAAAESDSTCSEGASSGWASVSNGSSIDLYCGSTTATGATASPSTCTIYYLNGSLSGSCPSTITITTPSATFPTSYALDVGTYEPNGQSISSTQPTASSSTSITVPAPTTYGLNVISVWDSSTNQELATVGYTLHECLITTNGQYGTTETCPY